MIFHSSLHETKNEHKKIIKYTQGMNDMVGISLILAGSHQIKTMKKYISHNDTKNLINQIESFAFSHYATIMLKYKWYDKYIETVLNGNTSDKFLYPIFTYF